MSEAKTVISTSRPGLHGETCVDTEIRKHARLSILLEEASVKYGSRSALARVLGIHHTAVGAIINGKRFVTIRQALLIEAALGINAREILCEVCFLKVDAEIARAKGIAA